MKPLSIILAAVITKCCCSFAPSIHQTAATTITTTSMFLFDLKQRLQQQNLRSPQQQQIRRHRIPEEELYFLSHGFGFSDDGDPLQVPYVIDLTSPTHIGVKNENTQNKACRLIIRHLEVEDIKPILPEIVREFGAIETLSSSKTLGDEMVTWIENFLFSFTVLVGLDQRVERRKKGYDNNGAPPDHNVICLVEITPVTNRDNNNDDDDDATIDYTEQIVGIAELSWQPPDPIRNAPPFVLPYFAKTLISRFTPNNGTNREDKPKKLPQGYISNVLTWKNKRGRGYSRVLMAALEGIARRWGCDDIRLHVDADEISGKVARGLYWSLGYEAVPDRGNSKLGYDWMGPNMANQGLYLVEGVPLLYLRKSLNEEHNVQ
jgi:GNAT superfamily N-acetyltransferase